MTIRFQLANVWLPEASRDPIDTIVAFDADRALEGDLIPVEKP
jgi:hypothetical protein